jgi:hypothetical protein
MILSSYLKLTILDCYNHVKSIGWSEVADVHYVLDALISDTSHLANQHTYNNSSMTCS